MKGAVRVVVGWLPLAIAVSGLCLLVYAANQQNYRQGLNDPQIQMAEDAAWRLEHTSATPFTIASDAQAIPMDISLSPWIAVVDQSGAILQQGLTTTDPLQHAASTATLDGSAFTIPVGVLLAASDGRGKATVQPNENRVTWEPANGIRQALVVVAITKGAYSGDFVVAGRNMREVELRETELGRQVVAVWALLLLATLCAYALARAYAPLRHS